MGLIVIDLQHEAKRSPRGKTLPIEYFHSNECKACPLNCGTGLHHPKMPPHGSQDPVLYLIGEAPGKNEDLKGVPFVGKAGKALRFRIPTEIDAALRWSNAISCRPPDNRVPKW